MIKHWTMDLPNRRKEPNDNHANSKEGVGPMRTFHVTCRNNLAMTESFVLLVIADTWEDAILIASTILNNNALPNVVVTSITEVF
jgi:hypothetical protein